MDPGSSIESCAFHREEVQQFLRRYGAKRGACDKRLRGFDPACPLPLLHFPLDLDRFL